MNSTSTKTTVVLLVMAVLAGSVIAGAQNTGQAMEAMANRLVDNQNVDGFWNAEPYHTGSIVPGLVAGYEYACDQSYLDAAGMACEFIIWEAQGNYFGDEAYALVQYGDVADEPYYLTEVYDFYQWVDEVLLGSTEQYIADFENGTEPSSAVFYVAHHTVAAYAVDSPAKYKWRQGLRHHLARVDDTSSFPLMGMAVAAWAFAQTDAGLDSTPVTPAGETPASDYWDGVTLADLPGKVADLQVQRAQNDGTFFEKLLPEENGFESGYSEDTIYAVLALQQAKEAGIEVNYSVADAREKMLGGIEMVTNGSRLLGKVYGHLTDPDPTDTYHFYAGKMLSALDAASIPTDLNGDDVIDIKDLEILAANWLSDSGCQCERVDINDDGVVNYPDFAEIVKNKSEK
ncbi:hypothetical protein STSP2_01476 [Anaerohalosphaera lusitana]|uniref:Dockerin domain-containing protein n=1 Tax=Anaerohalosphaera lusitana TaxID=1936003 RepID=A0A1U9NKI8_9BACT|nr:dockerin type I domain-containing protein [Anaerohalosphaera lusitana]AQT68317.1 hypothetical protein STSP2_01476 [Anaerohalosphaera lusitana]